MGPAATCIGGGCLSKNQSELRKRQREHQKSVDTIFDPEEPLSPYKKPLPARQPEPVEFDSYVSLSDNLRNSNIEENEWMDEHVNQPSVIVRKGNKKRPKTEETEQSSIGKGRSTMMASKLQSSDVLDACVTEEATFSRLTLSTKMMDVEFMLPKSRAGPLVVPFISFENYQPND